MNSIFRDIPKLHLRYYNYITGKHSIFFLAGLSEVHIYHSFDEKKATFFNLCEFYLKGQMDLCIKAMLWCHSDNQHQPSAHVSSNTA